MQTHPKKRIDVIVEAPLMRRIIDRLDQANVSGYSVMPITAGRGHDGSWTADGQISNATQMVAIVCIADASKVDDILDSVFGVISHQIGFVTISDVSVVRPERF
jgi:nitrogen regulatory protein PII